ncbi:S-adenosylmethionine uptake transporter [Shimia gijangensis]|uniref:S-adenosylmethionine uptake transporter n=1 Tax=Shimia gijangensis TaxID=1470563 RepID=A0A1M6MA04_9RHOB|nr:S-adenosylmethionine uptake transporter [Shimia gijangensis]
MEELSDNMKGALLMIFSMACFTFNDTFLKLVGPQMPLFQLLFLRGVVTTVLIYVMARRMGAIKLRLPAADWGMIGLRTASEIGAAYFFVTALMHMPIANVTAVLQVLPLTVTLGGALFFGEKVGWRRFLAIAIGFTGMLLIVRPGPEGFDTYAIYALGAVVCVTGRDLSTRRMSSQVPSMTVTLSASLGVLLFSAVATLGETWVPITQRDALLIGGASVFIIGGYLFSVMVMRVGEVGFIAPFRYTGLLWALLLGLVVFGDWPDAITLLGAAIVVATGVFTLFRESRARRRT